MILAPLVLALLAASPSAEKSPATEIAADEAQDVIFLSDARPIFLRLRLRAGGKSYQAAWSEAVARLHKYLDTDGDGSLSATERDRGGWLQRLRAPQPQQNGGPRRRMASPAPSSGSVENVVTVADLATFLRPTFGPFQIQVNARTDDGQGRLLGFLDRDGDQKLSTSELDAAGGSLRKFDRDDDEMIRAKELQAYQNPYFGGNNNAESAAPSATPEGDSFVARGPSDSRTKLVRLLLARYDRGKAEEKDNKLTRAEVGLDREAFDATDNDGDGGLDADELAHFLADVPPDLVLDVAVGNPKSVVTLLGDFVPEPGSVAALVRTTDSGGLVLATETVQVEISASGGSDGLPEPQQFFAQQFEQADGNKDNALTPAESRQNGVFDDSTFKMMDRNGDGKLTKPEMRESIAQDLDTSSSRTLLTVVDQGRALFDVLDLNRDGSLSARELRAAPGKVAKWDRDGDGRIDAEEIPRHFRLGFGRGKSTLLARFGFQVTVVAEAVGGAGSPSGTTLLWFRNMDRNRDGDLSPREFLGTPADFKALDADGDGLIDPQEAAKASAH